MEQTKVAFYVHFCTCMQQVCLFKKELEHSSQGFTKEYAKQSRPNKHKPL